MTLPVVGSVDVKWLIIGMLTMAFIVPFVLRMFSKIT